MLPWKRNCQHDQSTYKLTVDFYLPNMRNFVYLRVKICGIIHLIFTHRHLAMCVVTLFPVGCEVLRRACLSVHSHVSKTMLFSVLFVDDVIFTHNGLYGMWLRGHIVSVTNQRAVQIFPL